MKPRVETAPGGPAAPPPEMTRRRFLTHALLGGTAFVLTGCGGGSNGFGRTTGTTTGPLTIRPQTITLNLDTTPVAVEDGSPVNYLASYTGNGIQSAFWGTQQSSGVANLITQALVWDTDADQGVRVELDGRGLPTRIVNGATQAFVTCFWESDRTIFKFYQPSGVYVGGVTVTGAGPNFTLAQLADSATVGLFVGTLDNTTGGIFSLTLGGTPSGTAQAQAKPGARHAAGAARPAVTAADLTPALTRLTLVAGPSDYPAPAQALLQALSSQYLSSGASALFAQITAAALKNTGLSGEFRDDGLSIARGLLAAAILQQAAAAFLTRLNNKEDLIGGGVLGTAASSPGLTGYVSTVALPTPTAADKTGATGVMVSRDFGSVPVTGVVDSSGQVYATGSVNGVVTTMTGSLSGQTVSGQWTIEGNQTPLSGSAKPRDMSGGGDFNGSQQSLGMCMTQENSGGQGLFTNTYDLGHCGHFPFTYQAYTIPDGFQVLNGTDVIFDTGGMVSGGATEDLFASAASTLVTVVVFASLDGTAWTYEVGCPS